MGRAASTPPELPGYDFLSALGSGGFSDVFLYQQRLPRRRVAVKVLLTEQLNDTTRAQFVAEANLMAQLSTHPYIVTIYHADVAGDGRPYFVMEYCSGPSLADRYKRETFSVEDALRTGVRLAGAVATAHGAGILHRDIKPANVLTNDFGWPGLTDFGISSTLDDELPAQTATGDPSARRGADVTGTSESQSVGMSVPWSPAEMFEDDPKPDVRSDVFSLAATIHTLLAGQTPFEIRGRSNGALDLIGRIERGAITPIGRDDVPRSLTAVLAKGMATRRADRYATAVDFARALQRVELELGYSPTGIEVPSLHLGRQEKREATPGEDETRARSVTTIAAQRSAPAADETRARGAVPVTPKRPAPQPAAGRLAGQVDEATALRRGPLARPTTSGAHAPVSAVAAASGAGTGRRRALVTTISVLAGLALVGAIGASLALGGADAEVRPTHTPVAEPGGVNGTGAVPAPTLEGVTTSVDGTQVTFALGSSDPQDGDAYRWARPETPDQPTLSRAAAIRIDGVTPGAKLCLDVYLQRSDGKLSEANRVCNR